MKRITLILGVVAVMVAMLVAFAAPAMAKDNGDNNNGGHNNGGGKNNGSQKNGGINRLDNRLDRLDDRVDLDGGFLVSGVDRNPVFTANDGLSDELCDPLSSDAVNNAIPGCIFGDRNDDANVDFVSDVDFDTIDLDTTDFVSDIDDVDFVDVDRDIDFADGNNHNGNANGNHHNGNSKSNSHNSNGNGNGNHNSGGGHNKGHGK